MIVEIMIVMIIVIMTMMTMMMMTIKIKGGPINQALVKKKRGLFEILSLFDEIFEKYLRNLFL